MYFTNSESVLTVLALNSVVKFDGLILFGIIICRITVNR